MNERIREFAEQSFIVTTDGNIGHVNEYMIEKFAELIVRECSYLADQAHYKATNGKSAGGYIRQQFGVEE